MSWMHKVVPGSHPARALYPVHPVYFCSTCPSR